jgi:hypothetical protein
MTSSASRLSTSRKIEANPPRRRDQLDPGTFGKTETRIDADQHEIGRQPLAALQHNRVPSDPVDLLAEMEDDAMVRVERADEPAELGTKDPLRPRRPESPAARPRRPRITRSPAAV